MMELEVFENPGLPPETIEVIEGKVYAHCIVELRALLTDCHPNYVVVRTSPWSLLDKRTGQFVALAPLEVDDGRGLRREYERWRPSMIASLT